MSYRCGFCRGKVPQGEPLKRHVVKRRDGSILSETPVCDACSQVLAGGKVPIEAVPALAPAPTYKPVVPLTKRPPAIPPMPTTVRN